MGRPFKRKLSRAELFLFHARESAGVSQQDAADRLEVTQPTISQWDHGAVPHPSRWADVARVYKISVDDLARHFRRLRSRAA